MAAVEVSVPSAQPEVKLFGRWSFEDVEVLVRFSLSLYQISAKFNVHLISLLPFRCRSIRRRMRNTSKKSLFWIATCF